MDFLPHWWIQIPLFRIFNLLLLHLQSSPVRLSLFFFIYHNSLVFFHFYQLPFPLEMKLLREIICHIFVELFLNFFVRLLLINYNNFRFWFWVGAFKEIYNCLELHGVEFRVYIVKLLCTTIPSNCFSLMTRIPPFEMEATNYWLQLCACRNGNYFTAIDSSIRDNYWIKLPIQIYLID